MTLVVIPTFMRTARDLEVTLNAIASVRATAAEVDVVLVDDCSPNGELVDELERAGELVLRSERNEGFSRTVNRGLRIALDSGQDAVLVNADIEIQTPDWDRIMREQQDTQGRPAAVVGALLLYPGGELIQHAGVLFSFLTRIFDHRFRFAPASLPEALEQKVCPVTGAFQYIRHSTLEHVGLYDEDFRMAWEDVDYCLRVFNAELQCVYTSEVRAIHHESLFRGRADKKLSAWQEHSLATLLRKHAHTNMARFVPEIV